MTDNHTPVVSQEQPAQEGANLPDYGRKASDYPNWDPYVYGKPERSHTTSDRMHKHEHDHAHTSQRSESAVPMLDEQWNDHSQDIPQLYDAQGNPVELPFMHFHRVDVNDPQSNPFYGRWDPYAVVAFLISMFTPLPIIGVVLGVLSAIRVRRLRMKGFGLAVAAVVLGVISIGLTVYLFINGISATDFLIQFANWLGVDPSTVPGLVS